MYKHYRLKGLRVTNNLNQGDMANVVGISKPAYVSKENGINDFKLHEAKRIADYFSVPIEEIFFYPHVSLEDTANKKESM